jgi:hypothetical protein
LDHDENPLFLLAICGVAAPASAQDDDARIAAFEDGLARAENPEQAAGHRPGLGFAARLSGR